MKQDVGDVTILVNNAGVVSGTKFLDLPDDKVDLTFKVNTMAHFWVSRTEFVHCVTWDRYTVVPVFIACSMQKNGVRRPGESYHMIHDINVNMSPCLESVMSHMLQITLVYWIYTHACTWP